MQTIEQSSGTNGGGKKYDERNGDTPKPMFDLLPPKSLEDIAKVFTFGAKRYEPRNWEKGIEYGRIYAAIKRHLNAFWGGVDIDPDSGLPHLAHAGFGILVLLEYKRTHPELDDRSRG